MIDLAKMGNFISVSRREKGYTQDELGSRLGVSAQAISKWERGISLPDTDMLPDISRILGISVDYLLGISDYNSLETSFIKKTKMNPHIRENPLDFLLADELTITVSANLFKDNENSFMQELDNILKGVPELRNEMAKKRGLLLPTVRLLDSMDIPDNLYRIFVRGKAAGSGTIYNDKFLCVHGDKEAVWVSQEEKEEIIKDGGTCRLISEIILSHFKEVVINHAVLLTHKQTVKAIIENMKTHYPIIVEELIPQKISYDTMHKIIVLLISKGYPIRDMLTICEVINVCLETTDDIQIIVSEIEKALAGN